MLTLLLVAASAVWLAGCSEPLPSPPTASELVTQTVGPWEFREASDQAGLEPALAVHDAEQAALAHIAEQYRAPTDRLVLGDARYRRGLVSIEGFGAGAQGMPPGDAWVLQFTSATDPNDTAARVVVAAGGQVKASSYGY